MAIDPRQQTLMDVHGFDPDAPYWVTRDAVAASLVVTPRTLANWRRDRGFPERSDRTGYLDLRDVLRWCGEQLKGQWRLAANGQSGRERKAQAEAELRELELARQRGEVIDADEVTAVVVAALADLRNQLLTLGRTISHALVEATDATAAERIVTREVEQRLSALAARWREMADVDGEAADDQ